MCVCVCVCMYFLINIIRLGMWPFSSLLFNSCQFHLT